MNEAERLAEGKEEQGEILWVLARLKNVVYALDGGQVESIVVLDQEIIRLPLSDAVHLGVMEFRGDMIPVVDMRSLMGMEPREQEQAQFEQMLEDRKQDHIRWVETLKHSVATGEPFRLATDPHKCAFGKWYDSYHTDNHTVAFHLKKIDEPHQNLHRMALEMFSCNQNHDACTRKECLKDSLKKAVELYMPRVVFLLEEAKVIFRDSYRKMVVVLSNGIFACGVMVDEVLSAEPLAQMIPVDPKSTAQSSPLVTHLGHRKKERASVLVLDMQQFFASLF